MARIVTYTMVMTGVWCMLYLAGLSTGSHALLDAIGFSSGNLIGTTLAIAAIFTLSAVAGTIIIGLFTKQSIESSLVAGVSGALLTIAGIDFASIISYFFNQCPAGSNCSFAAWIISVIFTVFWAGYLISIVQWWRGNDI